MPPLLVPIASTHAPGTRASPASPAYWGRRSSLAVDPFHKGKENRALVTLVSRESEPGIRPDHSGPGPGPASMRSRGATVLGSEKPAPKTTRRSRIPLSCDACRARKCVMQFNPRRRSAVGTAQCKVPSSRQSKSGSFRLNWPFGSGWRAPIVAQGPGRLRSE